MHDHVIRSFPQEQSSGATSLVQKATSYSESFKPSVPSPSKDTKSIWASRTPCTPSRLCHDCHQPSAHQAHPQSQSERATRSDPITGSRRPPIHPVRQLHHPSHVTGFPFPPPNPLLPSQHRCVFLPLAQTQSLSGPTVSESARALHSTCTARFTSTSAVPPFPIRPP